MTTQIKLRRDTAANWTANDTVVLAAGEPGFETDTGKLKIGNGTNTWATLGYFAFYDQTLNTTDSVTFNEITSTALWQDSVKTVSPVRTLVPGATPTVVFATPNWFTSIKLVIAVEGRLDGDGTNVDHTQTCEATIAATYNTATEPIMSVYGIVYTSPTPLATFTVARNGNNIEVTATNSQTTNNLDVRVQAIQFVSRYE